MLAFEHRRIAFSYSLGIEVHVELIMTVRNVGLCTIIACALIFAGAQNSATAAQLQSADGGMAQYGTAVQTATSLTATAQAINNWSTFASSRSQWAMSASSSSRLASADWNMRQTGVPSIAPQQMANAATHLINSKLATMTAAQQQQLVNTLTVESTPKGIYSPNSNFRFATAVQNTDGTWTVTVSPNAFTKRKSFFQTNAPGMVSSASNFYPAEAFMVMYSVASGDYGFGNIFVSNTKKRIGDITGLDMSSRNLFGNNGYLARRPLSQFLDQAGMDQLFTDLGF